MAMLRVKVCVVQAGSKVPPQPELLAVKLRPKVPTVPAAGIPPSHATPNGILELVALVWNVMPAGNADAFVSVALGRAVVTTTNVFDAPTLNVYRADGGAAELRNTGVPNGVVAGVTPLAVDGGLVPKLLVAVTVHE